MEQVDFSKKNVLVYDSGMYIELAVRLARDFKKVYFHSPWKTFYPKSQDDMIGVGVPEIERVKDFWEAVDDPEGKYKIDLFVFPALYDGDLQKHLVSLGKRVWGSRCGDELERFRVDANEHFEELGLPRPNITTVVGIDALREHLKKHENVHIKISEYRGNDETWKHEKYETSEPKLNEMEFKLGEEAKIFPWIIEDQIGDKDTPECGYDGYCIDGQYPATTIYGYEAKDACYACHVKSYKNINPLVTSFNEKVSNTLKLYQYRNFFHTEIRVDKNIPYEIDTTCRLGSPPGELFIEMLKNLAEIMWFGAEGILIEPEFEAKYGVMVCIDSEAAENKWQTIFFPDKIRRWVKLRNLAIIEDIYCIIPRHPDFPNIGAIVAFGDSLDECIERVKEYADQIKGYCINIKMHKIESIKDTIKAGEAIGLKF